MPKKKAAKSSSSQKKGSGFRLPILGGFFALAFLAFGFWWTTLKTEEPKEAPEVEMILSAQADMPFQILIPAYMPKDFDRLGMQIDINQTGPGGEPLVQLIYRTRNGATVFIKEWVPVHPDLEILAASRPIETKWGPGWLLKQGESLAAVWVDIGPLRVSLYTTNLQLIPRENLLAMAESLGPASNRQVFSFVVEPPEIREVEPPPPVEIPINEEGVQEVTLVVTPGGYDPLRFAVKKGIPVRLIFRQLGMVGCGNELNFPLGGGNMAALKLESEDDKDVLEYVPQEAGEFQFFCGHLMYRGVLTVRE